MYIATADVFPRAVGKAASLASVVTKCVGSAPFLDVCETALGFLALVGGPRQNSETPCRKGIRRGVGRRCSDGNRKKGSNGCDGLNGELHYDGGVEKVAMFKLELKQDLQKECLEGNEGSECEGVEKKLSLLVVCRIEVSTSPHATPFIFHFLYPFIWPHFKTQETVPTHDLSTFLEQQRLSQSMLDSSTR